MPNSAHIKQILASMKLSGKEIQIFLSLVKLGKGTASAIARDSEVTRTHVYDIVEGLMAKGLVSKVEIRGVQTYEAVDHAGLMAYVSREQKELQIIGKKLQQLASDFNTLQVGNKQKTKVRFFDGVEGVKNIYAEIRYDLEKQSEPFELLTIFSPQSLERTIPGFEYLDYPNMIGRDIVSDDELLPFYIKQMAQSKNKTAYKVWPKDRGFFPTDTIAWRGKIAYIDLVSYPSGIIVENDANTQSFTLWFNLMWDSLSSYHP